MSDPRDRYFRRLRRLRRAARRWTVFAGTFGGATAILVPYHGLGWPDAIWAAVFGGSTALAFWRWSDARELAAQPAPEALDPVTAAAASRARIEAVISRFPVGQGALAELRRLQTRSKLRGSSVLPAWQRLDRAARALTELAGRLAGPANSTLHEAAAAERTLRDLGERTAAVERGMRLARDDDALTEAHADLLGHFTQGVDAYEKLVGAAAAYVAEQGRVTSDTGSVQRLTEATELLHGIADGLSEMRTVCLPPRPTVNPPRRHMPPPRMPGNPPPQPRVP